MPRNMSFSMTTEQVRRRQKDVTRRFGWRKLKPGDRLMAVERCMGLARGEKVKPICEIEVVSVLTERADAILDYPKDECVREGYPDIDAAQFMTLLCEANRKRPEDPVQRIEFRYV